MRSTARSTPARCSAPAAFEQATGDLVVDQTVQARSVSITADAGALTIAATGSINASGLAPGSITLAGGSGLTLSSGALLTAAGTALQADSTGAPIASENQATVSLTAAAGTLTLGDATIDVASADPTPLGQVILKRAAHRDRRGGETGDVAISAAGPRHHHRRRDHHPVRQPHLHRREP